MSSCALRWAGASVALLTAVVVWAGLRASQRSAALPRNRRLEPQWHLADVESRLRRDRANGGGYARLPYALERKYPDANREWAWQFVFPGPG
ncbi:MAG: hypothetical protein GWN99_17950, partial [Gemmatimonadetes bacterium]|nr:hypothetical protein [Gemmatimonadota bacterium]NIR75618.1 hypothetical protein [Candidatus Kutchimonas denitrificans]NIS02919.1 hypothetical protein [Gemmatimonadota bacterium]NIT68641.1 hypothetical protein [Gemmatimonadota bacterium]NIV25320.1 hypothetical protein [Gemmatimonadota bacterium]